MSEGQRLFLLWAWVVLGVIWLALMVRVVWVVAQWRKDRLRMRAKELEFEAWIGDVRTNPQCHKSEEAKPPPWICAVAGCDKPVAVKGRGSLRAYWFCSERCASKRE